MVVFWPMASGQFGQNAFESALEELKNNPYVTVEEGAYQRGYLSSHAENRLLITGEPGEMLQQMNIPVEYVMDSESVTDCSVSVPAQPLNRSGCRTKKPSGSPLTHQQRSTAKQRYLEEPALP